MKRTKLRAGYIIGGLLAAGAIASCLLAPPYVTIIVILLGAGAFITGALLEFITCDVEKRSLQATVTDLEKRVETLTGEIEDLIRRNRELINRFHSRMAHSMRIPISIVQGYADLLTSGIVNEEGARQEYLQKISERMDEMSRLMEDMLVEGRLEAELPGIMGRQFDLLELLKDIAGDMRAPAQKREIDIRLMTIEETLPVWGDESKLRRVFYNILENALKYMGRPGAVNITVSLYGEVLQLVFKDDGAGMDEAEAARIFEPGFQGNNRVEGSGVGLHLARLIVRAHGGSITARSRPGQGMGIYITLPRSRPQASAAEEQGA